MRLQAFPAGGGEKACNDLFIELLYTYHEKPGHIYL